MHLSLGVFVQRGEQGLDDDLVKQGVDLHAVPHLHPPQPGGSPLLQHASQRPAELQLRGGEGGREG